ncbi:MAG: hypothetical protein ACE5GC_09900 [Acidimicrobiia bacterium]
MSGWRRSFVLGLLVAGALLAPLAAVAADDGALAPLAVAEEGYEEGEETSKPVNESGIVPAVEAPSASEDDSDQPWTARYLAPTVLAMALVALAGSGAYYALRVRGKYRVVD